MEIIKSSDKEKLKSKLQITGALYVLLERVIDYSTNIDVDFMQSLIVSDNETIIKNIVKYLDIQIVSQIFKLDIKETFKIKLMIENQIENDTNLGLINVREHNVLRDIKEVLTITDPELNWMIHSCLENDNVHEIKIGNITLKRNKYMIELYKDNVLIRPATKFNSIDFNLQLLKYNSNKILHYSII